MEGGGGVFADGALDSSFLLEVQDARINIEEIIKTAAICFGTCLIIFCLTIFILKFVDKGHKL
ncbi:MAG: hypothetical protein WCG67_03470 [Ferruginibacter sp.]